MLNLGGLFFTLDADTRGLGDARRNIQDFARSVDNAFKGLASGNVGANFANGLLRQERSVVTMLERVKGLQDKINSSTVSPKIKDNLLKDIGAAYDSFVKRMSQPVPLNNAQFSRNVAHMRAELKDLEREFGKLNNTVGNSQGFANFTGVLRGMGGASLLIQGHLGGMSTRFFALTGLVREFGVTAAVTAAGVAGLTAGIALLTTTAISSGRELQKLQVAFTALTGNAAVAGVHLGFVKDVAGQAGIVFEDTAKGYMRFLASAQSGGLTLQQTQDAFRGMSLAAATMQLSTEDMQGVFRALDQMMSKGTVQAEELRGQLGDRLPGAFNIAAVAMGKTTAELTDMMKKGEVVSADFVPKFVAAVQRMWNIDPSKPINTLTASLNRLSNEWTYFGQELDRATGATRTFQALVDGLVSAMKGLASNLPQIIGWIGALTGAFIGLGVAMAVNALITWVGAMGGLTAVVTTAIAAVRGLATGVAALNVVMLANPALAVVRILITLASVLLGAKLGYDALTAAVNANQAAFNNTSAIESYITQQQKLGFQVRSTTEEMIRQIAVMNKIATEKAVSAGLNAASNAQPGILDYGVGAAGMLANDWLGTNFQTSPSGFSNARRDAANKEADSAIAEARRTTKLYEELQNIMKLPAPPATPVAAVGKAGKKGRQLTDEINQIEDYVLRMSRAEERLRELSSGNRQYKMVDDLFKAREALNQLNPKQLVKVDEALRAAGYTSGALEARLGAVFTRTRQAEEAARVFTQVWDDLDAGVINLENINKQLRFLKSGGDPEALKGFEGIARASAILKDIDPTTQSGANALAGLQKRLGALGITAEDTGNLFEDTKNQLGAFFQQEDKAAGLIQVFSNLHTETRRAKDQIEELAALSSSIGGNSLGALLGDPAESARITSEAVRRGQKVRDLMLSMQNLGAPQEEINKHAQAYLETLRQVDSVSAVYDRMYSNAERTRDALRSMVHDSVQGFKSVVTGVKSVGDALMNLANSLLDTMWQRFITQPLDEMFDNLNRKKAERKTAGLDSTIAGLGGAANDNGVAGVTAFGQAAQAAADAMHGNFISAVIGAATAAGLTASAEATKMATTTAANAVTAQGMLATISATAAITALGAASIAAAASMAASAASSGVGAGTSIFGSIAKTLAAAPGRAIGGPMSAGKLYQINEPGLAGEYFIPSVNGYMSPNAPSGHGGNSVFVDASGDIHVHGNAGPNEIAALRQEMRSREARLRASIPGQIDARMIDNVVRRPAYSSGI
jgi:tape measure domain-containing protein